MQYNPSLLKQYDSFLREKDWNSGCFFAKKYCLTAVAVYIHCWEKSSVNILLGSHNLGGKKNLITIFFIGIDINMTIRYIYMTINISSSSIIIIITNKEK